MRRVWELLLCAYLLLWVPLSLAGEILGALPLLHIRGAPAVLELGAHTAVAALCATAGWMVFDRSPAAAGAATLAVIAAAAVSVQSLLWTALPQQTAPGQHLPLAVAALAHAAFWLMLIRFGRLGAGDTGRR